MREIIHRDMIPQIQGNQYVAPQIPSACDASERGFKPLGPVMKLSYWQRVGVQYSPEGPQGHVDQFVLGGDPGVGFEFLCDV